MRSTNIKNLSIALKALSRFPSDYDHSRNIKILLEAEIEFMHEEQQTHRDILKEPTPNTQIHDQEIHF